MHAFHTLSLGLILAGPAAAFQQQFTVTTTNDTVDANIGDGVCSDANGQCSLRAAVQEANAFAGSTSIHLQPGALYPLALFGSGEDAAATGDLDVTAVVDIVGNAAVVDPMSMDRAFDVFAAGRLLVANLTVRNGRVDDASGGGYRSSGTLQLTSSTVMSCAALGAGASGGAIFNDGGDLLVSSCILREGSATRAGGAIEANGGATTIEGSRVRRNTAGPTPGNGGGFHLTGMGTVNVTRSSFSNNAATSEGGGLWNSDSGDMTVTNCKIERNQAFGTDPTNGGGGLFNDGGTMNVLESTIADNRALAGSGSGGGFFNNGGTLNATLCIVSGNSSMRAGGGFEASAGMTTLFNCGVRGNSTGGAPGNGGGLHLSGAGTVQVGLSDFRGNSAAAEGGGLWNSAVGVMNVASTVVRENVASGLDPDQGGGGLFNDGGELTLTNSVVGGNVADGASGSGGGVLNREGVLLVSDTRFEHNSARRAGGGVEANGGAIELEDVVFETNACGPAPGNGGALHLTGMGTVSLEDCVARGNTAAAEGGAFWNSAVGTMTVVDCDVDGNTASGADADQGGGGLFNDGGTMVVTGGVVSNNVADGASGSGGGVLNTLGSLDISMTTISGNSSQRAGGGIEANIGTTNLFRVRLDGNTTGNSPGNGGGLHLSGPGVVGIDESVMTFNSAANEGGGLWNSSTGTMIVTASLIDSNTAPVGPNVFNDGGTFTIDGDDVPPGP